ncbi:3532_t:CDS:1 [Gigaspora margarita]|uniref:3532_t:CDS:1 n=1 Tax=Gigaspora margarita TaxID=4874 RepID=A0ABN7VHC6_GIGMA|nr:3532_t:CDS:1 [Gigaspora margarita]
MSLDTQFSAYDDYMSTSKRIIRMIRMLFKSFRILATLSFMIISVVGFSQTGFFELKFKYDKILFIAFLTSIIDLMSLIAELFLYLFRQVIHKPESHQQSEKNQPSQLEMNQPTQLEMNQPPQLEMNQQPIINNKKSRNQKIIVVEMTFSVFLFLIYFGIAFTIVTLYGFSVNDEDDSDNVLNGLIWTMAFCWFLYFIFTYLEHR